MKWPCLPAKKRGREGEGVGPTIKVDSQPGEWKGLVAVPILPLRRTLPHVQDIGHAEAKKPVRIWVSGAPTHSDSGPIKQGPRPVKWGDAV